MKNIGNLIVSVILLIIGMVKTPNNPTIIYIFTGFVIVSLAVFFERQFPHIKQIVIPLLFAFALGHYMTILGFQNLIASLLVGGFFLWMLYIAFCSIVVTLSEKGFLQKRGAPK